jgi:tRNA (guanosine-2'-O-)-methyltransferase
MTPRTRLLLSEHFAQYVSEHKKEYIERVLATRTRHLTFILEDIYQSQNASAVVRTCECLGLQDVYTAENYSKYSVNPKVLKGSNKWLNLIRYHDADQNNTERCFDDLHKKGYKIMVTKPGPDGVPLENLPVDHKMALLLGNELKGASSFALSHADALVNVTMIGFTESLNLSATAAICAYTLIGKIHKSESSWNLTEDEKDEIRLDWFRKIVRRSDLIEREFLKDHV